MKRSLIAVAAAALIGAPLACAPAETTVRLGAILSLEGEAAAYGNSIRNGVELAVEEINSAGGIAVEGGEARPVELLLRDAKSDPQLGAEAAQELIEARVPAVIGADSSDVTLAIAPLFDEADIILLSPSSSSPKLSEAGPFVFRNFPSDELEALNTADYIYNKQGLREAAVIANQNEFGLGIKNAFIERFRMLGGRVRVQATYPPDVTDFSAQIDQLDETEANAIYIAGYSDDTARAARAIREAGMDQALFGTGAVLAAELVQVGGEAVEGLVFPQPSFDPESDDEAVRSFVAAYRDEYGQAPDTYAAHGYDAVGILAQAIQERGTDPSDIRFYLNSMNPYQGAAGSTNFNDTGDVRKFHRMFQIVDGEAVPIGDTR